MNRRDFLKILGLAPVALAAVKALPSQGETLEAGAKIDLAGERAKRYPVADSDYCIARDPVGLINTVGTWYSFDALPREFTKNLAYTSGILKLMPTKREAVAE